jgi:hypothetical protein
MTYVCNKELHVFRLYEQTIRLRVSALQTSRHQAVVHDCYLYFFSTVATTHCGFVFCSLLAGLYPPRLQGFLITHNDAPQSVGLLWTSDQSVAETST